MSKRTDLETQLVNSVSQVWGSNSAEALVGLLSSLVTEQELETIAKDHQQTKDTSKEL